MAVMYGSGKKDKRQRKLEKAKEKFLLASGSETGNHRTLLSLGAREIKSMEGKIQWHYWQKLTNRDEEAIVSELKKVENSFE